MLKGVLAGGISSASVLTLEPKDIKAVVVHYNLGASDEKEQRLKIAQVELVGWRNKVLGYITKAEDEQERIYTDLAWSNTGGGRVVVLPNKSGDLIPDYNVVRRALQNANPTLVFPLRLGRSSTFYDSHAHVTFTKSGAAMLAVWLDTLMEQT